jgi:hypothetical protein
MLRETIGHSSEMVCSSSDDVDGLLLAVGCWLQAVDIPIFDIMSDSARISPISEVQILCYTYVTSSRINCMYGTITSISPRSWLLQWGQDNYNYNGSSGEMS